MQTIDALKAACDWKLLHGSHEFPGPSGGTCINEAALVAAGFEYRSVGSASDMPECFSRPISQFAIRLNDSFSDEQRQRLIPFVTRLAGSADTREIELQRVEYLIRSLVNVMFARMMKAFGRDDVAQACANARTMEECREASRAAADAAKAAYAAAADAAKAAKAADYAAKAAKAADYAAKAAKAADYAAKAKAAYAAADAAADAAWKEERTFFADWGIGVLEGMLAIGRQAEPIETALVVERMEAIKAVARERAAA